MRFSRLLCFVFFQAEDGIRDLVRSRGLGDVYKRQVQEIRREQVMQPDEPVLDGTSHELVHLGEPLIQFCLLYTSDAADERSSVDLGGSRIIKKTNKKKNIERRRA